MNEKCGNIETWLKTAAQQPGPGIERKDEDEGWAGLSAMLDNNDARPGIITGGSGLHLRRSRRLTITAAALITSVLLLISLRRTEDITQPPSGKAHTTVTSGNTNNTAPSNAGSSIVHQPPARPSAPAQNAKPVAGVAASHVPALPAQKEPRSMMASGLSLQTLPLPGARADSNGLTLSGVGVGEHKWPIPSLPDTVARYPRWAVQAGFLATNDEGLGGRVSFMYRVPVSRHFYLQPFIGAGYTGNYNRALGHLGVQPIPVGTTGQYRTDSIWTSYRVQHMITADAGVRIGYSLRQFSFGTGIRYHNILQSKGDSTSVRKPGGAPSGTMYSQAFSKADAPGRHSFYWEVEAAYQWRFGLQAGISYQLLVNESASPAWQPPVFDPSSGSSSSTYPDALVPATRNYLQDKGRLEIYLRMPLGKKIK